MFQEKKRRAPQLCMRGDCEASESQESGGRMGSLAPAVSKPAGRFAILDKLSVLGPARRFAILDKRKESTARSCPIY